MKNIFVTFFFTEFFHFFFFLSSEFFSKFFSFPQVRISLLKIVCFPTHSEYLFQRIWRSISCESINRFKNICWFMVHRERKWPRSAHYYKKRRYSCMARLHRSCLRYWDYQTTFEVSRCFFRSDYDDILHDWWTGIM